MPSNKETECAQCGRPASVHASFISGHQCTTVSYCQLHAAQQGVLHPQGYDLLSRPTPARATPLSYCPHCKLTRKDFETRGRLGCPTCYTAFGPMLRPLLQRFHRSGQHKGKVPGRIRNLKLVAERIRDLDKRLHEALIDQSYDEAVRLRSEIERLRESVRKKAAATAAAGKRL